MQEKFNVLKNWIVKNGGYVNEKLYIVEFDKGNRGIYTSEKIEKGEKIIHIPETICISKKVISKIPKCENIDLTKYSSSDVYTISILLYHLFVEKEKSFYYPYLTLLPTFEEYSYHPICHFNNNKDNWISISANISSRLSVMYNIVENNIKLAKELCESYNIIPKEFLTHDNLFWCALILQTRQWGSNGLVPFADLLQHSNDSTMLLSGIGEMYSGDIINKNEPIYDNYGVMDDTTLFTSFGFVDKTSKNKIFCIQPQYSVKSETLLGRIVKNEIEEIQKNTKMLFVSSNGISVNLIYLVRILCLTEMDILKIKDVPKYYENVISLENEQKTNSNLLGIFKILIGDDKTKEILDKYSNENSLEHKIAYLNHEYKTILNNSSKIIIIQWLKQLKSPFNIKLDID
jgi:hypothetical protein